MAKTLRQQNFAFAGPTRAIPSRQDRPILPGRGSQSEHRIRFILPASHIISIGNHMISSAIWDKSERVNFSKTNKIARARRASAICSL